MVRVLLFTLLLPMGCRQQGPAESSGLGRAGRAAGAATTSSIQMQPLATPSRGRGPLFEELPRSLTGVDFVNYLRPENNVPYLYMGAGVAVGDYDNDGLLDLYLLSLDSPNRLYRQVAPFRFQDVTEQAGVDGGQVWSRGATFFDADGDGDLDLYVCNIEAPNLLYVNQGNGTFIEAARERGVDLVGASVSSSVADYDQDGDLDLYVVTHRPLHYKVRGVTLQQLQIPPGTSSSREQLEFRYEFREVQGRKIPLQPEHLFENLQHWEIAGQPDALLRNDGGSFTNVTQQVGIGRDPGLGLSATWLDVDQDGWLDLHVANDLQTKDRLYRNQGDGTFRLMTEQFLPHTTWFSMGADVGDINNDGRFDLLVADMASTTHYRAKVQMGDMDRFRYFMEQEWPPQLMRNSLFLNGGRGRFLEIAHLAGLHATDWTWAAKLVDLDNDGWLDAYFTNGVARADEMNPDLRTQVELVRLQQGAEAAARFIRSQGQDATRNRAYCNQRDLQFRDVSASWGLDHQGISYAAAHADLDGDGDLDMVVSHHNEPVSIYRNHSQEGHRAVFHLRGKDGNTFGVGTRVTLRTEEGVQVRQLFPVRGYLTCDPPVLHFGLGEATTIQEVTIQWPAGERQVFYDLPVDQAFTIYQSPAEAPAAGEHSAVRLDQEPQFAPIETPLGLSFRHREFPYNDYGVQPLLPGKLSQLGPGLAWGDANGDGRDDLFVGGAAGQAGQLFVTDEDGTFQAHAGPWQDDAACEDMAPLWLDVDSDGDLDLFVTSGSSEYDPSDPRLRDRLYRNDGQGVFSKAEAGAATEHASSSSVAAAADFDRDGDLDLFVGERLIPGQYPLSPPSHLLRNEGGRFVDVTGSLAADLAQAGLVTSALWSDVNGDGWLDLLITTEWGPVRLFQNQAGQLVERTAVAQLAERTGWWNALAGGDIDQDGDIDFVVTNTGWNTKYGRPTAEQPTLLYYGDMDRSGTRQLVEVKSAKEGLLPVRGLSCSSSAMPSLRNKFSTYHAFASSLLDEIYEPECLQAAERFAANELGSGLLINDGQGRFTWQLLPGLAQVAPGYGVTLTDLDGDGQVDIGLVQNLFSREPETGVWDGGVGLVLRGNGQGHFEPLWPAESGWIVPGDGKGLAIADLTGDGWPDVVAAQNDGPLLALANRPPAGRQMTSIRLQGRAGNPQAIGSRVWVDDGSRRRVFELYAGSGYLSQSAPVLWVGGTARSWSITIDWPDGSRSTHQKKGTQLFFTQPPAHATADPPHTVAGAE